MKKPAKSTKAAVADTKQTELNPWRQYRKPQRLPEGVHSFQFTETDGIKVVEEPSNHTATVIHTEGPALEWEIIKAMTYCQRSAARAKSTVPVSTIRSKIPMIDKYMDDDQTQTVACSEAGKRNARKETVSILAERLQMGPHTVERYFRKATK
jgi:hypothetical protein